MQPSFINIVSREEEGKRQDSPSAIVTWQACVQVDRITSGELCQAAVGSCPAQGQQGAFTAYRVAVLLY
jgi:hypothetical protein